jgi:hypothetical protein
MINLSDSIPAAIIGRLNTTWQEDGSGNVSNSVSFGAIAKITVAPIVGVLTLDASLANSFLVNVNAAITSSLIINPADGQEITILWMQDISGHTIVLPTNMYGAIAPSTAAGKFSCQKFTYNLGNTNWYAVSAGVTGM